MNLVLLLPKFLDLTDNLGALSEDRSILGYFLNFSFGNATARPLVPDELASLTGRGPPESPDLRLDQAGALELDAEEVLGVLSGGGSEAGFADRV